MQVILLAIVTFIFAIDQFSLTETLYRPICACPIIGAILGDAQTGLVVGGTYELMMIGNMPVGGAQPPNAVLGSIVAMIFAVKSQLPVDQALGLAVVFSIFGQYAVTLTFTVMSGLMKQADEAAEKADPKGITRVNVISCCILGGLFAIIAVVAYFGGEAAGTALQNFSESASWFMGGLGAAGGMMRYVGFAVLLKIMLADDMWGIYLAGFAAAALFGNVSATSGATLILVAFIGIAIALYDYNTNVKIKELKGAGGNGGDEDGI
ncbi:PTS sugar transporter subunit IIC [Erysipelotrichaceae bacterium Oil+RF-744-GAM-WT-6]|jgi:PTS system N-acetylgalactosamine-specific IIC component|uniref:PTS sugar transporter subunit IIC n=1 Tax=Stecheria intestinalis TaxID=2606630 RepID=A0A7X2NT78_9FIRM|nr:MULTISPECIES: PTS sugar transporter subunit IIC [Erysipelotrichaceae]MCI2154567.1 PTS sugar transporter subunit IIC [Solobacterium sp.]MDY3233246.1 PTS sugar transporter subunit IIC [Erysipelotrichaceae bacterium]MDY4681474.1 PTS sugar transporter subunit IIC [Lachnospiraceae bacterium]MCI6745411.1 PTS sugar transporter subunit IIC [Anaerolactibacter massiliensis]MDD5880465.1 PTS sugar transporter subunit IIC [Stecheria intestinalis]